MSDDEFIAGWEKLKENLFFIVGPDPQEFLNQLHIPPDVPDEYRDDIVEMLCRIPDGWGRWLSIDSGWYKLSAEANQKLKALWPSYQIHQWKEKFGTLRAYCSMGPNPCCVKLEGEYAKPNSKDFDVKISWSPEDPKAIEYRAAWDNWGEALALWEDTYLVPHKETEEHLSYHNRALEVQEEFWEVIKAAEKASETTCEVCGGVGELRHKNYWYKTICQDCSDTHYDGKYVVLPPDDEDDDG